MNLAFQKSVLVAFDCFLFGVMTSRNMWIRFTCVIALLSSTCGCGTHRSSFPDWHHELLDANLDAVERTLGPAQSSYDFTMADPLGEAQVFLYHYYPPEMAGVQTIQIREMHWQKDGYSEVIWLSKATGQWTVIDGSINPDGVVY